MSGITSRDTFHGAVPVPVPPKNKYTYEDYLNLDDDNRYELIGGELVVVPRPRPLHQAIVLDIGALIKSHARQNGLGKVYTDVDVLVGDELVAPDVLFISQNRLSIVTETNIQGVPDLVVEVLSPGTRRYDRKDKSRIYYLHGVKEYWIVDPEDRIVEVFIPGTRDWERAGVYGDKEKLTSVLLPGLQVDLKEIFIL